MYALYPAKRKVIHETRQNLDVHTSTSLAGFLYSSSFKMLSRFFDQHISQYDSNFCNITVTYHFNIVFDQFVAIYFIYQQTMW